MSQAPETTWKDTLETRLKTYGHRNWLVVADSAYPQQVAAGVETLATGCNHFTVLEKVLDAVSRAPHVRPIVYLDAELPYLDEHDAPGVDEFREGLKGMLADTKVVELPHEEIIGELDKAGSCFKVLLLKSNLTLPYTSVFIQLDCGYWSEEAENRLRHSIETARST